MAAPTCVPVQCRDASAARGDRRGIARPAASSRSTEASAHHGAGDLEHSGVVVQHEARVRGQDQAVELGGTVPMWQWIGEDNATTFSY